ncbi:MAG: DNA repair protein RecO [Sandaracinaceae bacterium]|nr:DNA repair protein RecO [Myxococcales bacterium]MCB9661614.1 DNA repair protein RecO [Sandaracinaceae bacterium]
MTPTRDGAVTTRAVVLRRVDYRESDRIVTLFTESLGKVGAIARAARSSQKRFAGGLESLCVVEVTLEPGRGELSTLREARPVLPCLALLASLERIETAGAGLELVRVSLADRHPEPELFEHVVQFLLDLDAGVSVPTRLLRFQLDVLDALGLSPELEQCALCGKAVPAARVVLFRAAAGGVVCRACGGGAVRVSAATREALLAHRRGDEEGSDAWPSDQQAEARALIAALREQHGLRAHPR